MTALKKAPYSADFYGDQAHGSSRSADVVLPIAFRLVHPSSMIDLGCGIGTWLQAASALGVGDVIGVDGQHARTAGLLIDDSKFIPTDLGTEWPDVGRRFDLAASLEVAEHLPANRSDGLVATLCALADVVLFSAAVPGQLGTEHVNLQLQDAWVARFSRLGYRAFDLIRPAVWNDDRVEVWYRQNTLVYVREQRSDLIERAEDLLASGPAIHDIVHPDLLAFWVRRATRPVSTTQALRLAWSSGLTALRRRIRRK